MDKQDYIKLLKKYKKKYTPEIINIRNKYFKSAYKFNNKEFVELSTEYKKIIYQLINEVVIELKKYYEVDPVILINGSLARSTNTIYSDIDINFLTMDDREKIILFEDKVNYILKEVLLFRGKDKIHSMVVYIPLVSNNNYEFIKKNKYPIYFQNGIIYSSCRKNAEQLMYESYNSTRNILDVVNYLNNHDNEMELNEWAYCFEPIVNSKQLHFFENNRLYYRQKNNIINHIDKAIEKIKIDTNYLNENCIHLKNSEIKKVYKSSVLFNVYNILAIIYRINLKVKKFELKDFIKNDNFLKRDYYDLIIDYLKIIQIFQMILDIKGIDLSSHSKDYLDLEDINKEYYLITGSNNIIRDFNEKKRNIYAASYSNLRRIRRMQNEKR